MKLTFSKESAGCTAVVLTASALFLGYAVGGTRAAQLWCFLLPFALLVFCSDLYPKLRKPAALLLLLGAFLSDADTGIRGYIAAVYQSDLLSGFVVESVANTHSAEAAEYFMTVWPDVLFWVFLSVLTFAVQGFAVLKYLRTSESHPLSYQKLTAGLVVVFLILAAVGWISRPWRHQYPVLVWMRFAEHVQTFKDDWAAIEDERADEEKTAAAQLISADTEPKTIVLMVGESITRDNLGLYGYSRNTTPKLTAFAKANSDFRFIPDAWSADASTVAAFRSMFDFRVTGDGQEPTGNLFAFFKAAGWHITWISNQDDYAIKSEWMDYADEQIVLNRLAGRSSKSMDDVVLAPLEKALRNKKDRQLIVVHMIGAHPHFMLRHPDDMKPLWDDNDAVTQSLEAEGRSSFVQISRQHYDLTVLYQDQILEESLQLTKSLAGNSSSLWFFLSDHGVETGDRGDRTGHSQTTPGGYRIPVLMWADSKTAQKLHFDRIPKQSFRSDWLSYTLLDAAGIRWKEEVLERSVFRPDYLWLAPASKQRFEPTK